MALSNGARLGPYEIVAPLGAGGMGEVYRAKDTKLHREVAIKVLPDLFATDSDRLARFQREAQVLASLNHHNIGGIYGLEELNGVRALILELVEGPTLADRIAQGRVPLDEALPIARQIADALETAHEYGIIHRDLKPANIKLRPDGTVKVLDFGLAKALQPADARSGGVSQSPTITTPAMTQAGIILGTAAYMSPEQARGKLVDKRADIWAFGCVLYEMVTGARPFGGDEMTDTIAAVVRADPDWGALPPDTPVPIRRLLRRCLEKDRKERVPDIAMARLEIKEALTATGADVQLVAKVPGRSRERAVWVAACLVAATAAGLTAWALNSVSQSAAPQVSRVLVSVAPADQLAPTASLVARPSRTAMALSPDGKYLVFSATRAGTQQLYLRAMDRLEATPIPGTEGSTSPFFSPDGQWVGFWQGVLVPPGAGELKKVPLSGGPAVTLCKTAALAGASWRLGDTILFSDSSASGGVWRVPAAGGVPQQVTTAEASKGEASHRLPEMLPGGEAVVFTIQKAARRWDDAQIVVRSLVTGEQKVLVEGGADARYVPTGHLVYARNGTLMAVPFDVMRLAVTGNPSGIVDGVMQDVNSVVAGGDTGAAQFSVSAAGALVYLPGGIFPDAERSLVWVDRNGAAEPLPGPPRNFTHPRLSPDGQQLAFGTSGTVRNVWIHEIPRGTSSRLTTEGQSSNPVWTPDGKRLTFTSATAGPLNLFWKSADGSGAADPLTTDDQVQYPSSWSPDGKALALIQLATATAPNADIWIASLQDGAAKLWPFLQSPFLEQHVEFSPDGRWLAYSSNESGRNDVYVQPYPGPGGRQQVPTDGGQAPAWARNGRELFYIIREPSGMVKMMAINVTMGPVLTAGKPRMLFEGQYGSTIFTRSYDVTPDGQRFVMTRDKVQPPEPALTEMVLVQNWTEELKRLVPTKR